MSPYDHEYLIAFRIAGRDEHICLKPDKKTSQSGYGFKKLNSGRPLMFTNGFPEMFGPNKLTEVITDVMFDDPNMVVNEKIKDFLSSFPINGLQIYPAVYVDLDTIYHEDLWFLNFYERLDCWDRDNSEYDDEDLEDDEKPHILRFSLNTEILNNIPEENRLMFSIDGLDMGYIFLHEKIANFLAQNNTTGIRMIPVKQFVSGMQNRP